jgi:hypothetical protein
VHDLPGFAYFNHSSTSASVATYHGRVDEHPDGGRPMTMVVLACHRDPVPNRPRQDVTRDGWLTPRTNRR